MSTTTQVLRRCRRLQEKRNKIDVNDFCVKRTNISGRKRKRCDTDNKYESLRKKQKITYDDDPNVMETNYFKHHLNRRQYTEIFHAVTHSEIYKNLQFVPNVIVKEISEYATGSFKKCYNNKYCVYIIHVLNEYTSIINELLLYEDIVDDRKLLYYLKQQETYAINNQKTKYFRYLSKYICDECCDDLSNCLLCNKLCINNGPISKCGHSLIYYNKCSIICDYCTMLICNRGDDTEYI